MQKKLAFTLAEVLIVLGLIGIIAEYTIPTLISQVQETEYRVGYKKAYSDLSQAFMQAISEGSLLSRDGTNGEEATAVEWGVMKDTFKVTQECLGDDLYTCWKDADRICTGECNGNEPSNSENSAAFVDASGRVWVRFSGNENIYMVDTNGSKGPNLFGRDRWTFSLTNNENESITRGLPTKVGIFMGSDVPSDITYPDSGYCTIPPCYYYSWLYN